MFDKRNEATMNTAEYAGGTVAACGFACPLDLLHDCYDDLLRTVFGAALQQAKLRWLRLW